MSKKQDVISSISLEKKQALLNHFDNIYECNELTEYEYKMIYLAWLWAKGFVFDIGDEHHIFEEDKAEVSISDYEINFEDDPPGGVNLNLLYDYYSFDKIIDLMEW